MVALLALLASVLYLASFAWQLPGVRAVAASWPALAAVAAAAAAVWWSLLCR